MELFIQNFIKTVPDWERILTFPPFSLAIKRKDKRIIFKYTPASDPRNEIVKEARGLILEDGTFKVVAFPFKRFFNYGEPYADKIDWESAVVETKHDGSLIKVYFYDGEWKVGTNNTIDAEDAKLQSTYENFRDLFNEAAKNSGFNFDKLDPHYTYDLELCSSFNHIVVYYDKPQLFHIGTRSNLTLEEVEVDIGVEKPKQWKLSNLEECIDMVKTFGLKTEGFVVKDKNYNRIKIKSQDWVAAHRISSSLGEVSLVYLIQTDQSEEVITYFPEVKAEIIELKEKIKKFISYIETQVALASFYKTSATSRAEFAAQALKTEFSFIWFWIYDNVEFNPEKWVNSIKPDRLLNFINKYC